MGIDLQLTTHQADAYYHWAILQSLELHPTVARVRKTLSMGIRTPNSRIPEGNTSICLTELLKVNLHPQ